MSINRAYQAQVTRKMLSQTMAGSSLLTPVLDTPDVYAEDESKNDKKNKHISLNVQEVTDPSRIDEGY